MVGNLIAKNSVMSNICKIDGVLFSQVNIRDKNGNPSWAEYWTEERIKSREVIGYRSFQKEYMNNPITEGEVFTEMVWGKCPPLSKFRFLVCYGDPSPSNNKTKINSMSLTDGWTGRPILSLSIGSTTSMRKFLKGYRSII